MCAVRSQQPSTSAGPTLLVVQVCSPAQLQRLQYNPRSYRGRAWRQQRMSPHVMFVCTHTVQVPVKAPSGLRPSKPAHIKTQFVLHAQHQNLDALPRQLCAAERSHTPPHHRRSLLPLLRHPQNPVHSRCVRHTLQSTAGPNVRLSFQPTQLEDGGGSSVSNCNSTSPTLPRPTPAAAGLLLLSRWRQLLLLAPLPLFCQRLQRAPRMEG